MISLETATDTTTVYSPLEQMGRDIYIREGCSVCHSQQIRPLLAEVERYGPYSRAGEFVYDRPFLWGSKPRRVSSSRESKSIARLAP